MAQAIGPVFQGDTAEQELAGRVFEAITGSYGGMFAREALIHQSVSNLAAYLAEREGVPEGKLPARIDAVIKRNPDVFAREERNGEVIVATTRNGLSHAKPVDTKHMLPNRLYEPEHPLAVDDLNNIVTTVRQAVPVAEPVLISSYWLGMSSATATPSETAPNAEVEMVDTAEASAVEAQQPAPVAPAGSSNTIMLRNGTQIDLALPLADLLARHGTALAAELRGAFDDDPLRRVVHFGGQYYTAEELPNFGKNDLRRIRDFIVEQGQPVTSATILTDLYRTRPSDPKFERDTFGLDYRLSRERDFEFAGMRGAHLWSAKGLPAIGGKRVKTSDLGPLFGYLQDGYDDSAGDAAGDMVLHTLTYFEWEYGILPLDAALSSLLPGPLLEDQRTAVIRIESAQHYTPYLCEVRFSTGTRGGWVWGLEEFFHEYLVPGVSVSLTPTTEPNVFTIGYDEAPGSEVKLLHLDEKRNKFVFMQTTYYAAADEALLPSQTHYGKLRNLKVLPMSDRKKVDVVLSHVFETVGEQLGSKEEPLYWITFDELHLAINVLRPMSKAYLTHLLSTDEAFYADEATIGAWYYKPAPEEVTAGEEVEEDDLVLADDEDDE